jgi:hypothetical protein
VTDPAISSGCATGTNDITHNILLVSISECVTLLACNVAGMSIILRLCLYFVLKITH